MMYTLAMLVLLNGHLIPHPLFSYYQTLSECEAIRAKVAAIRDEHVEFYAGCFDIPTYMANYERDEQE